MALPTSGSISLGRLRAEYDPAGSNTSVSIGNYNNGGTGSKVGANCCNITTQVLPSTNTSIYLGAHAYGHSFVITANSFAGPTDVGTGVNANAYNIYGATGSITSGGPNSGTTVNHYIRPADGASVDQWQVNVYKTGGTGTFTSGTNNAWTNCNTGPTYARTRTTVGAVTVIATVDFKTSGNTTLRARGTGVTWYAERG